MSSPLYVVLARRASWLIAGAIALILAASVLVASAATLGSSLTSNSLRACTGTPTQYDITTGGSHSCN